MQPFLALITPLTGGGAHPDNTLPTPQPPLGIWGPTDPRPGWGLPGNQPYPDNSLPGRPPGTWGGGNVPMPNPPIYIPPEGSPPPLGIWGPPDPRPGTGLPGEQPKPSHPIVLPPGLPAVDGENRKIEWKTAWAPTTGWVVVGVPNEGTNVPTPSRK